MTRYEVIDGNFFKITAMFIETDSNSKGKQIISPYKKFGTKKKHSSKELVNSPLHSSRSTGLNIFIEKESKLKGIKDKELILMEELKQYSQKVDLYLKQDNKEALLDIALT